MITDKENDSIVWLYKEISKKLSISESRASEIVHLCFEEFRANIDSYNEALNIRNNDLEEEITQIKEKMSKVVSILSR